MYVRKSDGKNFLGEKGVQKRIILKFILKQKWECEQYSWGKNNDQYWDLVNMENERSIFMKVGQFD
jgi:hypothetical protein